MNTDREDFEDSVMRSTKVSFTEEKENGFPANDTENNQYEMTTTYISNGSSEYYYYDDYYEDDAVFLKIEPFELYMLGIVRPILVFLTIIANIFVVYYFLSKRNRGKASNLLFISIAFSDTMTGLVLLPNSFAIFHEMKDGKITELWCKSYMLLRLFVSPVFHTVSVWQTAFLGIQRYVCVCHPFISARVCTFWKTGVSIGCMYVLAFVLHSYHITSKKIHHVLCQWRPEKPCGPTCTYLWFSLMLQHLLPVVLLLFLTIRTLTALHVAHNRASTIISSKSIKTRTSKEKVITVTATWIAICFLIPELPYGIYKMLQTLQLYHAFQILTKEGHHIALCVYEITLILSFNANFWIYCLMMKDFRQQLLNLITLTAFKKGIARLRPSSVSSSRTVSVTSRNKVISRTTSVHSTTSENNNAIIPMTTLLPKDNKPLERFENTLTNDDDVFM